MSANALSSSTNLPVSKPTLIHDWEQEVIPQVDKRHLARMALVQALFAAEFPGQSWEELETVYDKQIWQAIRQNQVEYDREIAQVAVERPVSELAKIDLIILRLILHESKTKDTPAKVLIDEGVELAKDFGGENSYAFVNAVLEKLLLKDHPKDQIEEKPTESSL